MAALLVLHTLDGRDVYVNPNAIVTITEARREGDPKKQTTDRVHCVITLSDGKAVTVEEDCDSVRRRLEEGR